MPMPRTTIPMLRPTCSSRHRWQLPPTVPMGCSLTNTTRTCMGLRLLLLLLVLVLVDMGGPMPLPIMGLTPLLELVPTHRYVYMHAIRDACPYMELATDRVYAHRNA